MESLRDDSSVVEAIEGVALCFPDIVVFLVDKYNVGGDNKKNGEAGSTLTI